MCQSFAVVIKNTVVIKDTKYTKNLFEKSRNIRITYTALTSRPLECLIAALISFGRFLYYNNHKRITENVINLMNFLLVYFHFYMNDVLESSFCFKRRVTLHNIY